MLHTARARRHALWLTLVAMVLGTLAPGIARALSFQRGDAAPWRVVCAAISDPRGSTAAAPATDMLAGLQADCPFCLLQAGDLAPPPAASGRVQHPLVGAAVPALFLGAPHPLHAWQAAQARAPPHRA